MARACRLTSTTLSAVLLSASLAAPTSAQSLDIGGVELHLGQDVTEAAKALSMYVVLYREALEGWQVVQAVGDRNMALGWFYATNGKLTRIEKVYDYSVRTEIPELYTKAIKELQRRTNAACDVVELETNDGIIRGFERQCGQFRLQYFFDMKLDSGLALGPNLKLILGWHYGKS